MKHSQYCDERAVCPYYEALKEFKIACRQSDKGIRLDLKFPKREVAKRYFDFFCCSMDNYCACEVAEFFTKKES